MGGVSYGNPISINRDYGGDFIPIVEIDYGQIGQDNSTKKWKYDGFEIKKGTEAIKLSNYIDSSHRTSFLNTILIHKSEIVVKFFVKQGNSQAKDNDGYIEIRPSGAEVLTKKTISIEYGKSIALRISTKDIKENAFIDFYASDDGGTFDSLGLTNIHCGRILIKQKITCLVLYGSGFLSPLSGDAHHAGDSFKLVAEARNKLNQKNYKNAEYKIFYTPTDLEFFEKINGSSGIVRLDVYSHAWQLELNLGGFKGKRKIGGVTLDGDKIDWSNKNQDGGADLRRVDSNENLYFKSTEISEILRINKVVFSDKCEIYFWGCNAGGQLTAKEVHVASNDPIFYDSNPKNTFAQYFAKHVGKGNVFALVGKGIEAGSMFKTDSKGKEYFDDGELIPANISANNNHKNTKVLKAFNYMKKFPL